MKVSSLPRHLKTDPEAQGNPSIQGKGGTDPVDNFLEDQFSISPQGAPEPEVTERPDPFLEHLAFYGTGPTISKSDFAIIHVPRVDDLVAEAEAKGIFINEAFLDRLKGHYLELAKKIEEFNDHIEESKKVTSDPNMLQVWNDVVDERKEVLIVIRGYNGNGGELAKIEGHRNAIRDLNAEEFDNLKA
jgi:hypothetical protein